MLYKVLVMATIPILSKRNSTTVSILLVIARVILGLILVLKAIFFISNAGLLREMLIESRFATAVGFFTAYVMVGHLLGGVLIVAGLFLRIAVVVQLPLLLGALFFIIPQQGFEAMGSDFAVSAIALVLSILLLVKGGGKFSMDSFLKNYEL